MSSIDERVVKMQFDNAAFKKGAVETQKSLSDLNKAVDSTGKSKGLLDMETQMGRVAIAATKMQIVTATALATIANKAVNAGINVAKALTFDPIKQGFLEYESLLTKQNVIMNATGKSAKEVKSYLNDLNRYSDQTIYSFGDMTDSITKFVNAGVSLDQSVVSIKGIANAAAYSGASSQEASRAMYAFSQSMQTGYIMLQDWMQIENANMGTQEFKNTLLEAGVAAGTLTREGKGFVTASGKFVSSTEGWRDGLQEQWATTEVLNSALGKYADRQTELGKKAFKSAQDVRTFTAFMDTLKESIGSGWSAIFTSLIGNLKQATSFWTDLSNAVGNVVGTFFNFAAVTLKVWRRMGGFEKVVQGFKNILAPFAAILKVIGDAWQEAFPSSGKGAGKALYGLSAGFEAVTRPLQWLADLILLTTPLMTTFFKVLKIGWTIAKRLVGYLVDLATGVADVVDIDIPKSGGFLDFLKDVGKAVKAAVDEIDDLLSKGKSLGSLLGGIDVDLPGLPSFGGDSGASGAASAARDQASGLSTVVSIMQGVLGKIGDLFSSMWDGLKEVFSGFTMQDFIVIFNQALFTAFAVNVIRITNSVTKAFKAFADIGDGVGDVLSGAGAGLKSFQTQAQAKLVLNIAIAIGVLAVSLWLLSKIPLGRLLPALGALGGMFIMLTVTMKAFGKVVGTLTRQGATANTLALSVAMAALAFSMLLLSAALLIMNKVEWNSIGKGLVTMVVMMKTLQKMGNMGKGAAVNMIAAGAALLIMANAMIIMAAALLLFQKIKWGSIGKAGAVIAGMSLAIGLLALIPYQGIAKVGLAMATASVGMIAMAAALLIFEKVEWSSIGKAAVTMGLLTISLAVLMAVGGPASVAAMLGLAGAMVLLALACRMFNDVEWASLAKASVVLTVLLLALAVGAVILTAFTYAIAPVSPVLMVLGGAFALLGLGLLAFAAAMAIAMTVGAAGVAVFATLAVGAATAVAVFLQTLALQAPVIKDSLLAILQSLIDGIVEAVPMIIQGFKDLWEAIKKEMSSDDKKKSFGQLADEWLDKLIKFVEKNSPKVQHAFVKLVEDLVRALVDKTDEFAALGTEFIIKLIEGFGSRQGKIVAAAVATIIKFADGLRAQLHVMTDAGVDLIADFLHDLADSIRSGSGKIGDGIHDVVDAFFDVGVDMIQGLVNGVTSVDVQSVVEGLAAKLPGWARKILKIESPSKVFRDIGKFIALGLTLGIQDHAAAAIRAVASMVTGQIAIADEYISKYIQKLDQSAIAARSKANGLADAAKLAAKNADKTKTKTDDKAARNLAKDAKEADKKADKAERKAEEARKAEQRKERWENATSAERAEIRSNDAQRQLAAAKAAEGRAASNLAEADALERMAKADGVTAKQRKEYEARAAKLRKEAREEAKRANELIEGARQSAASALQWQTKAGKEAAESFQEQFQAQADAAAEAEAFDKLSDADKAASLREQAAAAQKKADEDLAKAKKLAYTDIDKANKLAQQAMDEAQNARDLLEQAEDLENNSSTAGSSVQKIDLTQTTAAAASADRYRARYDASYAAAATGKSVVFNQVNQSPESLSAIDIYRLTNNQISYAADKLVGVS